MSEAGTLEHLLLFAGEALQDFSLSLQPGAFEDYIAEFGIVLPDGITAGPLAGPLADAATAAKRIAPVVGPLRDAIEATTDSNLTTVIAAGTAVASEITATAAALNALATAFAQAGSGVSEADLRSRLQTFAGELPRRILDRLLLERLDQLSIQAAPLLAITGLVDDRIEPGVRDDPNQLAYYLRRIYFDLIGKLVTNPSAYLREAFGWGELDFDAIALLERIKWWLRARRERVYWLGELELDPPDTDGLNLLGLRLLKDTSQSPPGLAAELRFSLAEDFERETNLGDSSWVAKIQSQSRFDAGLRGALAPDGHLTFSAGSAPTVSAHASLSLENENQTPVVLLSLAGGTRLEAHAINLDVGIEGLSAQPSLRVTAEGLNCILDLGGGDSFLKSMSGGGRGTAGVNIGATWSPIQGLQFSGSGTLEIAIPAQASVGPATIETIYFVANITDGTIPLELSAAVRGQIGPVTAVVDRVGVEFMVTFPQVGGNLGPLQFDARFKAPSGAGLSVDAAGVTGGGFLRTDDTKHEYAGVLQLQFINLALQAFGLITTQVAGGPGYSLLALIDAEFPPIQLGWGFTLEGVGGLFAVHRTASTDALHAALKAGQLSSILFPKNAITNAPVILAQLDAMFPTAPGRFLFGPMALIGWGKPRMLKASIGVVVELPEPVRVILLSRIEARLPNESNPVVRVNMDALGVLDLGQNELSFDAILFDSKIIDYTLSGTMALRAAWGSPDHREFVLAIGGVHPRFTPPPDFPQLQRITIDMPSGSISKLRLAAYMAVTANAIQFGANLDVFLGASGFSVSGHLGFDALLQIIPFRFDSDISGKVAIAAGGDDIASVDLEGTLSGPKPYHIAGQFKVHIVFFDVGVSFDYSWGGDLLDLLAPAIDVADLLETALADVRNWDALLQDGISPLVTVRQIDNAAILLAHPLARPGVRQSVVPFGLTITRFGEGVPSGDNTFTITGLRMGTGTIPHDATQDDFAPAQFFELTDDEKLERPSFERHDAGLRVKASDVASGALVPKTAAYETFYVDTPGGPLREDPGVPLTPPGLGDLSVVLQFGSAGRAATRNNRGRYQVPGNPIRVAEPAFVLADKATMTAAGIGPAGGATFSEMHGLLAGNRALQILGTYEMTVN